MKADRERWNMTGENIVSLQWQKECYAMHELTQMMFYKCKEELITAGT